METVCENRWAPSRAILLVVILGLLAGCGGAAGAEAASASRKRVRAAQWARSGSRVIRSSGRSEGPPHRRLPCDGDLPRRNIIAERHPAPVLERPRPHPEPAELLELLLEIESRVGRRREERNGPRTLDLDLLLVGDRIIEDPRLSLPHPRMWERGFVLEPLAEIHPGLTHPGTGRGVAEECRRLGERPRVRRIGPLALAGTLSV